MEKKCFLHRDMLIKAVDQQKKNEQAKAIFKHLNTLVSILLENTKKLISRAGRDFYVACNYKYSIMLLVYCNYLQIGFKKGLINYCSNLMALYEYGTSRGKKYCF